eukprot:sb/3465958/
MIRGKCFVFLLTVVDSPMEVLSKEDNFFFILGYDAATHEIHEDKGSIMLGRRYQAEMPDFAINLAEPDQDTLIWDPSKCDDMKYEQLCFLSKSLQELRNIMCYTPNTAALNPQPDDLLFGAMDALHATGYGISEVPARLVEHRGILDSWSVDERVIFERALLKLGKQFNVIRQEFLPWKSSESIIRFYYHWKGTDSYKVWKAQYQDTSGELKELNLCLKEWTFPKEEGPLRAGKCPGCKRMCKECSWYLWGPEHASRHICWTCSLDWRKYGGFWDAPELDSLSWDSSVGSSPSSSIFLCRQCGKSFKTKSHMRRHEALVHTNKGEHVDVWMCGKEGMRSRRKIGRRRIRVAARRPFRLILGEL